jgi:ABC-type cobalamin/Fe3+-siderophores transport system ATPase subunit
MLEIKIQIPTQNGDLDVQIPVGKALFILGRNGTGKSALVQRLTQSCRALTTGSIIYLPGSRPSYFDGDSLNMTPNGRSQYEQHSPGWDASPDIRIRPVSGTSRNERAIYDLQAAEVQYRVSAADEIESEGVGAAAIARLQSKSSPLNRVNRLLQQANLPVQAIIDSGELKAVQDGVTYSIAKMSDGERTALIFIADVISASPGSIFLVDEPELHLHRSIVVPLLSALLSERPDCTAIVSTHELALANDHPDSPVVLVRGCDWIGNAPSAWHVDVLPNSERIPEDLRLDLFGARQTILFVEGTSSSRDHPLYATLFPNISLRHRSSCVDVRRAVVGLKHVEDLHHVRAFGLVDNDSMSEEFEAQLLSEDVYALSVFSIESLYYSPEMIEAVAGRQAETFKIDSIELIANAESKALSTLRQKDKVEHLASRIAERRLRDKILMVIPSREAMVKNGDESLVVEIQSPYPAALLLISELLEANNLYAIIAGFPVRESGILNDIAKALHFIGEADYEKAARAVICNNAELAEVIKSKLGGLAKTLQG